MTHLTFTLPDDPAAARNRLIEWLAEIAREQVELSGLLDELNIPTCHAGHPLTFHQRVAVMAGFYEAAIERN